MKQFRGIEMNIDLALKKRLIFASFFILQNRMQTLFDNYLEEITSKQWLIMVIVSTFPNPPSLTEIAEHAGCSRQNVKKIAVVLEKKGFLELKADTGSRAVCIVLKQKFYDFYEPFLKKSTIGIEKVFEGMTVEQIESLFNLLNIVDQNVCKFANSVKQGDVAIENKE